MKILYISSNPTISTAGATGAATHILSVIKGLQKLNVDVKTLIAADEYLPDKRKTSRLSAIWKFFPLTIRTLRRDISLVIHGYQWKSRILKAIEIFNPDIIYERAAYLHMNGINIAKKLNIPILIEMNSPASEVKLIDGSLLLPLALYIEKRNLSLADTIVTVSEAMKNYLIGRGAEPTKIQVIRNAANIGITECNIYDKKNKPSSNFIVGHVGSFASWQKIDILIKAFAIAKKSYPKLNLFLIGDGPLRKNFEVLSNRLGVSDSVIFMGRKTQREILDILINYVDIAACVSDTWYGSPTKIFEYGAAARPVIAFRTPAILEIIEHGKTGLLVSSKTPDELAAAIIQLIENSELRFKLAENWQRKVLEEYTWDLVASKTLDICKKILNKA